MKENIIVYEKSTCSKCRETEKILREKEIPFEQVLYHETPLGEEKLSELIAKMGISAHELVRTGEKQYRELGLKDKELSEEEMVALMVKYPDLMQRPIVERGDHAVLARPPERVLELL